ncbi:MAG: hypothetical protein M0R80_29315 [Proteobacteria bacterium]|jgi:hypothetical protein|nr:hypothetical protein [Pseudomonadota bacterium]
MKNAIWTWMVAAALLPACSDNGSSGDPDASADTDADTDTGTDEESDSDSDTHDSTWSWNCPDVPDSGALDPCDYTIVPGQFNPLVTAGELDGGITFVTSLGTPSLILAERSLEDDVTPFVVVLSFGDDDDAPPEVAEVGLLSPPDEPLRARGTVAAEFCYCDMAEGFDVIGYRGVGLLCGDSGCALYGVLEEEGVPAGLLPIPGGEVPLAEPVGLYWLLAAEDTPVFGEVCAYGDGIACFDGAVWSTVEAAGTSLIRASDLLEGTNAFNDAVLVADDGQLYWESDVGDGMASVGPDVSPLSVSWFPTYPESPMSHFIVGGDEVVVLGGGGGEAVACAFPGDAFPVVLGHVRWATLFEGDCDFLVATLFNQAGDVFGILQAKDFPSKLCSLSEVPLGPPRAVGFWIRPLSYPEFHQYVVTETGVYSRYVAPWW